MCERSLSASRPLCAQKAERDTRRTYAIDEQLEDVRRRCVESLGHSEQSVKVQSAHANAHEAEEREEETRVENATAHTCTEITKCKRIMDSLFLVVGGHTQIVRPSNSSYKAGYA